MREIDLHQRRLPISHGRRVVLRAVRCALIKVKAAAGFLANEQSGGTVNARNLSERPWSIEDFIAAIKSCIVSAIFESAVNLQRDFPSWLKEPRPCRAVNRLSLLHLWPFSRSGDEVLSTIPKRQFYAYRNDIRLEWCADLIP